MGFRFSRRMTLFPGVRLNFSAKGMSVTVGPRGASVNIGPRGSALNLGVPGTGLSYRQPLGGGQYPDSPPMPDAPAAVEPPVQGAAIQSAPVAEVTSEGLQALKDLIIKVRSERADLARTIPAAEDELAVAERRLRRAQGWFLGLFLKKRIPERQAAVGARAVSLKELRERLDGSFIDAEFALDDPTRAAFEQLTEAFSAVAECARIWDVTNAQDNDRYRTRSSAATVLERRAVRFNVIEQDEVLETSAKSLRLQNANGADLNIYPGFLLLQSRSDLALVDLREVTVEFSQSRFIETEEVPSDSTVVDQTWAKCNKDGSRDKRFANNYQIPVALYGTLHFASPSGLHEEYMISNAEKAQVLARSLSGYQAALRQLGEMGPGASRPKATNPAQQLPTSEQPLEVGPLSLKAVEFLRVRNATAVDDATETMMKFAQLLRDDLQAFNGQKPKVETWHRFVAACGAVPPVVRDYFVRSPAAQGVAPVATREVNKMLLGVFGQLQAALEPRAASDAEVQGLLKAVREQAARVQG